MLNNEENDLLCRVGPGTPMGNLLRQYWVPALPPAENIAPPSIMMEEANWFQNLEGDLDTAHLDWLHSRIAAESPAPKAGIAGIWTNDKQPRLQIVPTPYGAYYSGIRTYDAEGN